MFNCKLVEDFLYGILSVKDHKGNFINCIMKDNFVK